MVKRSSFVWVWLVVGWSVASAEMPDLGPLAKYVAKPDSAYNMFGELVFDGQPLPYFLSTNVRIVGEKGAKIGGE